MKPDSRLPWFAAMLMLLGLALFALALYIPASKAATEYTEARPYGIMVLPNGQEQPICGWAWGPIGERPMILAGGACPVLFADGFE